LAALIHLCIIVYSLDQFFSSTIEFKKRVKKFM